MGECGCCDGADPACCGDGTRQIGATSNGSNSAACLAMFGNDDYDLAGGAAGTSTNGTGVNISGTTGSYQLGITLSADMGYLGEYVLGATGTGPITISFTAPTGKRICAVRFGVSGEDFGTNNTYDMTLVDTGGTVSATSQPITSAAYTPCSMSNSGVYAQAATGKSITSIEISHGTPADNFIGIGHIGICLADA